MVCLTQRVSDWDVQKLSAYLYADDGLLTSTQVACLQQYFDTPTEIFDRVGFHTNEAKTFIMSCHNLLLLGVHFVESCRLWMTR